MMNAIQKYMSLYGLELQNKESKIPEEMQTFERQTILCYHNSFFLLRIPGNYLHASSTVLLSDLILSKSGQYNENDQQVPSC